VICAHLLHRCGWKGAMYDGNVDPGLFENGCGGGCGKGCGKDGGYAVAALGTIPAIAEKRRCIRVEILECGYNCVLKILHILCEQISHGLGGHCNERKSSVALYVTTCVDSTLPLLKPSTSTCLQPHFCILLVFYHV